MYTHIIYLYVQRAVSKPTRFAGQPGRPEEEAGSSAVPGWAYIYIYILHYIHICICICIYTYTYIHV